MQERVRVAGLAKRSTLVKYALIDGVGASLPAPRERQSLATNLLSVETPEIRLRELEDAAGAEPDLNIWGVHRFTCASRTNTIDWVEEFRDKDTMRSEK